MINSKLLRIATDSGDQTLIKKIRDAIRNRMAFLFVRGDDGFVLKPVVEDGAIGVIVWAAWGDNHAPRRHLNEVKSLARKIGARWIRFHSARKGWLRVAPRMGWARQADDADGFYVFQITL